jgi:hypothetical protein
VCSGKGGITQSIYATCSRKPSAYPVLESSPALADLYLPGLDVTVALVDKDMLFNSRIHTSSWERGPAAQTELIC